MTEKRVHRITADFSGDAYGVLGSLQTFLEVPSKADVLRKALGLLNFAVRQQREGWKFQMVKNGETKELIDF